MGVLKIVVFNFFLLTHITLKSRLRHSNGTLFFMPFKQESVVKYLHGSQKRSSLHHLSN